MNRVRSFLMSCLVFAVFILPIAHAAEDSLQFDIPRLDGITVDGDASDWAEEGFKAFVLTNTQGVQKHPEDFDASFRLGWDDQGLLVLLNVTDDIFIEHEDPRLMWLWDSAELFLAAEVGENKDYYQAVVSPGVAEGQPELRTEVYDNRVLPGEAELSVEAARVKSENGYVLEVRLPWANLGIAPSLGEVVGFQVFVNDVDEKATDFAGRFQLQWYSRWTKHGSNWMHKVRLAKEASPDLRVAARGAYYDRGATRLFAVAEPGLAGKSVAVFEGERKLGEQMLIDVRDRCQAEIILPTPRRGEKYGPLDLRAAGESVGSTHIRTENKARDDMFFLDGIAFETYCFTSTTFPRCDFQYPRQARDVLGNYSIRTTFYDNGYNEVSRADRVGRYGAVVEVTPEAGPAIHRNITLVRVPVEMEEYWPGEGVGVLPTIQFPAVYGVGDEAGQELADAVGLHIINLLQWSLDRDKETAVVLGELYDGPQMPFDAPARAAIYYGDRAWWNGLLRKLDGQAKPPQSAWVRRAEGESAPTLREGTPEDAGFAPDTVERLDALCREWVEAANEGMVLLVARNGVVVFHRAYGERDMQPVVVDTPMWIASITKTIAGTCMMMLVDQGQVDLTAPISDYLPMLRDTAFDEAPVSVRSLYTHTHGIPAWFEDYSAENEVPRAFDVAPGIAPHEEHYYCGVGYSLGSRIIERVSGKCLAEFYHDEVLAPLGMEDTLVFWDSAGAAMSTAYDMAVLGQMLLNGGAYGDVRLMRPETVEQMRPTKLSWVKGEESAMEWGIGTTCWPDLDYGQFSESTYGHDGSSGSILRIDPENNLLITGVRSKPAGTSDAYRAKFFNLVHDCLVDPAPVVEKPHQQR